MTAPESTTSRRGPLLAIVVLVAVVAGAAGLWYLFFRPAGPAPVSLGTTPPIAAASATADAGSPSTAVDPSASPSGAASPDGGTTSGIAGTWNVDPSVGSFADFSSSFVGYR